MAGQKSSYTFIKNVKTLEVWPQPTFAAIWLQEVCHLKIPETVPKLLNGAGTPAALLNVAQGGFKQLDTVWKSSANWPPETSITSSWGVTPLYKSLSIPSITNSTREPAKTVVS